MRTVHKRKGISLILACIFIIPHLAFAKENVSPVTNSGKKWRIGYFQGGDYYEFRDQLKGLVNALMIIGWIKPIKISNKDDVTARQLWLWLSKNIESNYIEIVDNAFWDSEWDEQKRESDRNDIYGKAVKEKYIDLMIAMGTKAGVDLLKICNYSINTIIMCANTPSKSGIIKGNEYSGVGHFYAINEADKFYDEVNLFYRLVKFKILGIIYKDDPEGRIYAALEDVKRVATERGFRLVERKIPKNYHEEQVYQEELKFCNELAEKVDAIYLTNYLGEGQSNIEFVKKMITPMLDHNVATWSQTPQTWMVKYGVLLSLEGPAPADIGMFAAKAMAQILRGKKPSEISQFFVNPKSESVTLNLETAQKIQLDLGWDVLATAEKVYEKIEEAPVIERR